MPRTTVLQSNYSAGEVSPLLRGRTDFQRYQRGAARIENFLVLLQGGLQKRPGTRYVATCKSLGARLTTFIFRSVDAVIFEVGHAYIRFYKNGAQLLASPGVPVEVVTPYAAADVFALRFVQKNDVVYITHRSYPLAKVIRVSDTVWQYRVVALSPPPTTEAGRQPATLLTLSALTGSSVTATASTDAFLPADVGRELTSGAGLAVLTAYTSPTVVTVMILEDFLALAQAAGTWTLHGSPLAQLKPSDTGPVGTVIGLELRKTQPGAANLVLNGDFSTMDLTDWTNLSGPFVAFGTHDGGAASATLDDSTAAFLTSGVQTTHLLSNVTDGSMGPVAGVTPTRIMAELSGGADDQWDLGDAYEIYGTGSASAASGAAVLLGGSAGLGWIVQEIATVVGQTYAVTFDVGQAPIAAMVGSVGAAGDLVAEASYPLGESTLVFTASQTTTFLSWRNNQNQPASVDNIACRIYGIDGWRAEDVGRYVFLHGGLVRLTGVVDAQHMMGMVLRELSSAAEAPAGAWTLETDAWSATNGYPGIAVFHQQRFIVASLERFPQTTWGSAVNDFEQFTRGTLAADSFSYTLAEAEGLLYWIVPAQQLLIGAENGPFRMSGDNDGPILASNPPSILTQGDYGTSEVEALLIGFSVLFVGRQGSKLREITFQPVLTSYLPAEDISILSGHLLDTHQIVQMDYAQEPIPVLWLVRSDGTLLGLTYEKQQQIVAWHRQVLGGGGLVRSVATIPHPTRNASQTWVVVERVIGGVTTQYVEVLSDTAYADSCVEYSGVATTTMAGLAHLEGQSVRAAGIPETGSHWATFPAQVVTGGQITLDVACTNVYAGVAYEAVLETLPPEVEGAPSLQPQKKRWDRLFLSLFQTGEGLYANGQLVQTRVRPTPADDGAPLVTGDYVVPNQGWGDGVIRYVHSEPLPCTILNTKGQPSWGDE